jgi:hypothetical protein
MMRRDLAFCRRGDLAVLVIVTVLLSFAIHGRDGAAQPPAPKRTPAQVDVTFISAEILRLPAPIRIGVGTRTIEYQEALVVKLATDRRAFDALPPSMEPYLYIGAREYRIFQIDRDDTRSDLVLTFHIRDWTQLVDGTPFVLTVDHGGPVRDPDRFGRPSGPRFSRQLIVDKR